jgi:hypothetical protein
LPPIFQTMNFGTVTTTTIDSIARNTCHWTPFGLFDAVTVEEYERRKQQQAIDAEDRRRAFVALCVRFKPSVRLIRTVAIAVKAMPKFITRQHKTKQSKILQMRFA